MHILAATDPMGMAARRTAVTIAASFHAILPAATLPASRKATKTMETEYTVIV